MMRALPLLVVVACTKAVFLPVGTRVPVKDLEGQTDLRAFVVAEIDKQQPARAYFALDLLKTRPYIEQQLDTSGQTQTTAKLADLRPLVGELVASSSGRGLKVVAGTQQMPVVAPINNWYWAHIRTFESRVNQLNEQTPGVPYSFAARRAYGVTSAEETGLVFSEGETFLSFVVHGDRAFGFVVSDGKFSVKPLAMPVAQMKQVVKQLLGQLREPGGGEWRQAAAALHAAILGPFAAELAKTKALFVSPDGFLANLPFALLLDRGAPIIDRMRVTYIPSASVYRQLVARPILNDPPRLMAIGNAAYPQGVPPLPFAEREASTVSELFPSSILLSGKQATEGRTIALAPKYNILHFATHGLLLGHIARDASSLLLATDDNRDGFLNAAEIASLDLSKSYIVVLSACETAVSEDAGGSIDLGSITNAFLSAGAPSVIGSLWQVEDEATTALMLEFYKRFLEVGAGEALRQAMLALKKDPRFEHPFFWAAFTLYGWDK